MCDNILLLTSTTSCLQMIILLSILSHCGGWWSEVECITLINTGPQWDTGPLIPWDADNLGPVQPLIFSCTELNIYLGPPNQK